MNRPWPDTLAALQRLYEARQQSAQAQLAGLGQRVSAVDTQIDRLCQAQHAAREDLGRYRVSGAMDRERQGLARHWLRHLQDRLDAQVQSRDALLDLRRQAAEDLRQCRLALRRLERYRERRTGCHRAGLARRLQQVQDQVWLTRRAIPRGHA